MKMEVLLYAGETPLFSFSSGLINLQVKTGAKFSAVKPDGSLAPLFRLDVDGNFSGNGQIQNAYLTGQLKMNNLTLTLGSSEIGDFKTDALEKISEMAMNTMVIPKLNVYLKKGFLVPKLKSFSLINSQLLIKNGFVVLFTDVRDSLTG